MNITKWAGVGFPTEKSFPYLGCTNSVFYLPILWLERSYIIWYYEES